jgi:hypothetical protein
MPKPNWREDESVRFRIPRVTPEIIERIKLLTNSGMLQKRIASRLKLCRATVSKIQHRLGMPCYPGFTVTPMMEGKILQLLRIGYGQPKISAALGIPAGPVRRVMLKHHHSRPKGSPGHRYKFSVEELRAIARDLRTNEQRIAKEWGVTRHWISRFRNSWWNGGRRKKNAGKPASGIPQKPTDPDTAITLIQRVTGGKLPPPEYDDRLVEVILKIAPQDIAIPESIPLDFRETFVEKVKGNFATGIKQALGVLRESQTARWKN